MFSSVNDPLKAKGLLLEHELDPQADSSGQFLLRFADYLRPSSQVAIRHKPREIIMGYISIIKRSGPKNSSG